MDKPDGFVQIHPKQNVSFANWLILGRGLREVFGYVSSLVGFWGLCVGTPNLDFLRDGGTPLSNNTYRNFQLEASRNSRLSRSEPLGPNRKPLEEQHTRVIRLWLETPWGVHSQDKLKAGMKPREGEHVQYSLNPDM